MISLPSLIIAPFGSLVVLGMGKPICLLMVAVITGLAWLIAYCRWFLYHRLICLGRDLDVIGAIVDIEEPVAFLKPDWDNDYSINLLLQNTEFGVLQALAEESEPYGNLIKGQDVITNPPVSRDTHGYKRLDKATGKCSAVLHAEFEGAGNYDLLQISEAMLGFAVAALAACVFLPPPFDMIVGLALLVLALLGWLLGAVLAKTIRPGDPSDVDPNIGTLHVNDCAGEGGLGSGADIVYVQGTWVFDPVHDGYNEIHPIKICMKMMKTWDGDWSELFPDLEVRVRHGFQLAQAEETLASQALPEHQWQVHPDLDGCASVLIE